MKSCSKCGEDKDESAFYADQRAGHGLKSECKSCHTAACVARQKLPHVRALANARQMERRRASGVQPKRVFESEEERLASRRSTGRKSRLSTQYGLSLDEHAAMLQRQGGKCAICNEPPIAPRPLAVDHCHTTGRVRGLLCDRCNHGIGHLGDSPARLQAAIAYLVK